MDQKVFKSYLGQFKKFDLDPIDAWKLADHMLKKIKGKRRSFSVTNSEYDYLIFILQQSVNLLNRTNEALAYRQKLSDARRTLMKDGRVANRMKEALALLDLGIKPVRRDTYLKMKECYERLNAESGELRSGRWSLKYSHNGERFLIEWSTPREKKLAFIDAIKKIYRAKSRNAVIAQLRILETKGLPALEGSGHYRKDQRP